MAETDGNTHVLNLDDWRESRKPIVYRSSYGEVHLYPYLMMTAYEIFLQLLNDDSIDSKNFTIKVLNQVALVEKKDLEAWDEQSVLRLAGKWANMALVEENKKRKVRTFDDFRVLVSEKVKQLNQRMLDLMNDLRSVLADTLNSFYSQLNSSIAEITRAFDSGKLLQSVVAPLIPELAKTFRSAQEIVDREVKLADILVSTEYELAPLIISPYELLDIKGRKFSPAITNKIVGVTRTATFLEEVRTLFSTPRLKKRLQVINQAMGAHQARQYYLSTPVFISQTEGIFTDWLIVQKLVRRKQGKIFAHKQGKNKNNRLDSLSSKVKHAKEYLESDDLIKPTIENVLARMVDMRNGILHGEKSNYGTAANSTKALLLVIAFAGALKNTENQLN